MTTSKTGEKPEHRLLGTHTGYAGWAKLLIATIRLADGHTVELWCDSSYGVIQLYTGDTLAVPRRRLGSPPSR